MNLRRFLNTAYYLLVEEYQRVGIGLLDAVERLGNMSGAAAPEVAPVAAAQNEQAMALLQGALANVPNSPMRKKPRRA